MGSESHTKSYTDDIPLYEMLTTNKQQGDYSCQRTGTRQGVTAQAYGLSFGDEENNLELDSGDGYKSL